MILLNSQPIRSRQPLIACCRGLPKLEVRPRKAKGGPFGPPIISCPRGVWANPVTVSLSTLELNARRHIWMQAIFDGNDFLVNALAGTISKPRLKRYMYASGGDKIKALDLYHWNIELSKAMYFPVQVWEISLRNRLNSYLSKRFGANWPYDPIAMRQMTKNDLVKLDKAKGRQQRSRRVRQAPTPTIVADLSAGFWVSLLSDSYEVSLSWPTNIGRVFPYDAALDRATAHQICTALLDVRNRIAHHEAIYSLPLADRRSEAERLVVAMCPGASAHLGGKCSLVGAIAAKP